MSTALAHRSDARTDLLERLRAVLPGIAALAPTVDATAGFPSQAIAWLAEAGALAAPLPAGLGGLGLGTEPARAALLLDALRLIGGADLSLGRVYEGHVNALRLVVRHGSRAQARQAATDAAAGHLFALWNTEPADDRLRLTGMPGRLSGSKILASAAGHATRALVTADIEREGGLLLLVPMAQGERADCSGWTAQGMRGSASGRVRFDGVSIGPEQVIGAPGDYQREPDFSAGAWRASAVALGGLDALIAALRAGLVGRARDGDPHQRARFGRALIAQETARLWLRRAAVIAEGGTEPAATVIAYVGLARLAVEAAVLDALRLTQRSIGLGAFLRPDPIERLSRDLGTYLRQPAPDEVLTSAAAHFMHDALPEPA